MNRKPRLSSLLMPRDRKTAAELIEESATVTIWLTLLMFAMGILLMFGLLIAALRDTPPSQSAPITTTVEDYR